MSRTERTEASGRVAGVAALVSLAILVTACGFQPSPSATPRPGGLSPATLEMLNPQPPVLPRPSTTAVLPDVRPLTTELRSVGVGPLATTTDRVSLSLLVIGTYADDATVHAWEDLLGQAGIPHEVLIATEEELTVDRLVAGDDTGRFHGILLATNNLAFEESPGVYASAFSAEEWSLLFEYERAYGVRQVALYSYPGVVPEDHGIREAAPGGSAPDGYTALLTAAGEEVFGDLADSVEIPVRLAWVYRSELTDGSSAVPLLVDSEGNVLGVTSVAPDGRERLVLTFGQGSFRAEGASVGTPLLHTQLLGHGLIRWVTRGLYLGERRIHFNADVDDWFIPTGLWDVATGDILSEGFVLSARDAWSFAQQTAGLRAEYAAAAADLTWSMAYNGEGADLAAVEVCDPDDASNTLSAMTICVADDFLWVNHTWRHAYMDRNPPYYDISYAEIYDEISWNDAVVTAFGLGSTFSPRSLVTGNISGLGWYSPDGSATGPRVDFGLEASNPDLLAAAADLGRSYIASNMSTRSHEPECASCGIVHPLDARILTVPRWPTNVFATVSTPEAAVQAYNLIYGPAGTTPFFPADLTYAEYLDVESDIALAHVLAGSAYPHYFHVANLFEYAPGRSILTDWADALLTKYTSYVDLPLRSLGWDDLGAHVGDRTAHAAAGLTGVWDREAATVAITAANGGTAFLTGASFPRGSDTKYGGDLISRFTFTPGQTVTLGFVPRHALTVDVRGGGIGLVLSSPSGLECTGTCRATFDAGTTITLAPVPIYGSVFAGWSGVCTGTGACVVTLDGAARVNATFLTAP